MPEVIQDLYAHCNHVAFAWEDEPCTAQLVTWFVDHGSRDLRTCQHSRTVTLLPHFPIWEQQIRHVWHEYLRPAAPYEIHIVSPSPPNMATDIVAHVILIQNPDEALCTSLITLYDHTAAGLGPHRQLALTTAEHIYLDNLIHSMALTERCLLASSDVNCEAWYHQVPLILGRYIPGRNGYGIYMHLRPRPPRTAPPDDMQFLQLHTLITSSPSERLTHGQVAHTHGPQGEIPSQQQAIRIINGSPGICSMPSFITVPLPVTVQAIQLELATFGLQVEITLLASTSCAVCSCSLPDADNPSIIFVDESKDPLCDDTAVFLHSERTVPPDDIALMTLLYRLGFEKAVILSRHWHLSGFLEIHFTESQGRIQSDTPPPRQNKSWPDRQPHRSPAALWAWTGVPPAASIVESLDMI